MYCLPPDAHRGRLPDHGDGQAQSHSMGKAPRRAAALERSENMRLFRGLNASAGLNYRNPGGDEPDHPTSAAIGSHLPYTNQQFPAQSRILVDAAW